MKSPICCIVAAGETKKLDIPEDAFLIAADAGLRKLQEIGRTPDLAVGDFDSLGTVPEGLEIVRHPIEKDDTDTMLAIREAIRRGYKKLVLLGALGGRFDHAYANVQALGFITEHGCRGLLYDDGWAMTEIRNTSLILTGKKGEILSVFCPNGRADGVSIAGTKYSLSRAGMESNFPLGVSNEFLADKAEVSVEEGSLLIMWQTSAEKAREIFADEV